MAEIVDPLAEFRAGPVKPRPVPPVPAAPPEPADHRPVPASELTPEQLEIRRLEDQLAKLRMARAETAEPELVAPSPVAARKILIHFIEDGFTACGQVWVRGQELEFDVPGRAYESTKNRFGTSWLDLAGDDFAQVDKYGKIFFRLGPWPGKKLSEGAGFYENNGGQPSDDDLKAAEAAEAARGRSVPVTSSLAR